MPVKPCLQGSVLSITPWYYAAERECHMGSYDYPEAHELGKHEELRKDSPNGLSEMESLDLSQELDCSGLSVCFPGLSAFKP
ncbi:hypothetical protein P7K49_036043 [Saguinus oedipus]|uniref:Uncharacterized protein n=1 Tax=Saguinus oedipus TaxID=9490 RepID=A0ABQ9TQE2_SAGOE|nr:hypothetical protein P7K49_036043 [Saguinus oedipus]